MQIVRKATLAAALGATALASFATPAMARDRYYHRGGGNTAAVAVGVGILGLAVGAIAASSANRRDRYDDRYYDDRYNGGAYNNGAYNNGGWYYRDGYYWDRDGRRYDRNEWQRYQRGYEYRSGYDRDYDNYRRGY